MMTPRLNKQHQWLPSCFDVNWQVFNLSNLMHDLNGGSSRMKTFPFQRLSTYSPPPHFFYTFCTFLHIFLIFLHLLLPTLSTSALGLKNSEPGPMPKVLKGKNDLHFFRSLQYFTWTMTMTMTPDFRRGNKEYSVLLLLFCASIDIYCCFQTACFVVIISADFCCCCYKCCFVCCNIWRETLNCLSPLWDVGHSNKLPT